MRNSKVLLLVSLLTGALFAQLSAHTRSSSITFDEGPHIAAGYAYLRTGDLRLQPVHIHPPLANVLAAAPLLLQPDLPDPRRIDGWEIASLSAVTDAVVWQYPHPARLALATRLPIIGMTLLLAAVVGRWAADLWGPRGGLLALALLALDPNIVAHGSLVTTDMAVTLWGTAALFLAARALRRPRRGYAVGAGVALGLALASKVSALSLIPALLALALLAPVPLRQRLAATLGGLALAALTLWAVYGFEVRSVPGIPFPLPAATHLEIYRSLQSHYRLGHPAFLLGQNRDHGWWYYFPVAFALKTPLPTVLLALAALVGKPSPHKSPNGQTFVSFVPFVVLRRWAPLTVFPLVYLASASFSTVNIGYRHLLPVLPFLYILAGRVVRNTEYGVRIPYSVLRIPLLLWLALGTLGVAPNYLAFFNELAGGPAGGYRYLVDSNLDWGQNLWQLRDWMRQNGVERVYYAHYSPARPEVYGVPVDFLPPDWRAVPFTPLDPAPGVYAIGATVLQGVYTPDVNTYAWFRARPPLARLGYALFLYRVKPRPAPRWAALCTDAATALSPDALRAGLGRPDLRAVYVDCSQTWVSLTPGPPGVLALPPETDPPPGAALDVPARRPNGRPLYTLYRLETAPAPEHPLTVALDGPLEFVGYSVFRNPYSVVRSPYSVVRSPTPDAGVELWTFWRVKERPTRLLSLMGHLLGPDGAPVAAADGMGFPPEFWEPGDLIVQRHRFSVPADIPLGEYTFATGAYWLDTMERWRVEGEPTRDQIMLTTDD
ncbi:MAG: phospholipid carrier-dependent glycosyltransferase [Thermoflexia bacterium]|nr:MAG: phospholipid carrier-dependent glycosyltransferase [Thermoflexia bacterium]